MRHIRIGFVVAGMIIGGVVVVDTSEISTQPNCSLFIFDDAPDGGVGESVGFVRVGSVKLEFTCAFFIAI